MLRKFFRSTKKPRKAGSANSVSKVVSSTSSSSPAKSANKREAALKQDGGRQDRGKQNSAKKAAGKSGKPSNKAPTKSSTKKPAQPKPDWTLDEFQVPEQEGKTRFHDLDLPDSLMHGLHDMGFEYCSQIQAQILPHTMSGHDAIGKAQTGTGKTAAFLLTIFEDLLRHPLTEQRYLSEPRALIVAPTRELAVQIADDAALIGKYVDMKVATLIGGVDYQKQKLKLNADFVDIVVATPGRLIDFMTRKDIYLDRVESLVLDEADRMLDMGFIPQVKRIVRAVPTTEYRQTQLYSATFTQDILNLAARWTHDPVTVEIEPENVATDTVDQKIYMVAAADKLRVTCNLLRQPEVNKVIVFANRRDQTQRLHDKITAQGIKAGILTGEIPQQKRSRTLEAFKQGKLKVLVATDVVGRGIHVDDVSHVVNYNLPEDPEDYVHRIGRTGRAGAEGISISLACEDDAFQMPAIETLLGTKLNYEMAPDNLLE